MIQKNKILQHILIEEHIPYICIYAEHISLTWLQHKGKLIQQDKNNAKYFVEINNYLH